MIFPFYPFLGVGLMCGCTRSCTTVSAGVAVRIGVVKIPSTSRVNSSSCRVRGVTNPLICSLTASWIKVWISETSPSTFSDEVPVTFSSKLPFSLNLRSIDVLYRLLIPSSLYSSESSIQVSFFQFNDEFVSYLVVYKNRYSSNFTKNAKWRHLYLELMQAKLVKIDLIPLCESSLSSGKRELSNWLRTICVRLRWIWVVTWPMVRQILTIDEFSLAPYLYL